MHILIFGIKLQTGTLIFGMQLLNGMKLPIGTPIFSTNLR